MKLAFVVLLTLLFAGVTRGAEPPAKKEDDSKLDPELKDLLNDGDKTQNATVTGTNDSNTNSTSSQPSPGSTNSTTTSTTEKAKKADEDDGPNLGRITFNA